MMEDMMNLQEKIEAATRELAEARTALETATREATEMEAQRMPDGTPVVQTYHNLMDHARQLESLATKDGKQIIQTHGMAMMVRQQNADRVKALESRVATLDELFRESTTPPNSGQRGETESPAQPTPIETKRKAKATA